MLAPLPENALDFMSWPWEKIAPYYQELAERPLNASNVDVWLLDWTRLDQLLYERYQRLMIATNANTEDAQAEQQYRDFLDAIFPRTQPAEQALKEKLLASGLQPQGFEIPLRNMRSEAALFREPNVPLMAEEMKVQMEYDQVAGAQTVEWEGQEKTLAEMFVIQYDPDRSRREAAWRKYMQRTLQDRDAFNQIWVKLLDLRLAVTHNAGLPDYRAYRWQQMLRFDYTPEDDLSFLQAIQDVVVPAAERLYERRCQRLGLDRLRPWDVEVDPASKPPLQPFQNVSELEERCEAIFHQVDPQIGEYFSIMRREGLLDLPNRRAKAPGAYCTDLPVIRRPFIFGNAVGTQDDVNTLLHEGGHAFHVFESAHLPYIQQLVPPMEFAEVASMSMELLASPYLTKDHGGFYTPAEAARAQLEKLEGMITFWPYMAVVDAFQHWAYTHPQAAHDPAECDAAWAAQWDRFMRGVDWTGLEQEKMTGWHRKLHIFQYPFYYLEYGLAQLGSVLVWRNALQDQAQAVAAYRHALSLGGAATLPELYKAAGARLSFDAETLGLAVDLIERTMQRLEAVAA